MVTRDGPQFITKSSRPSCSSRTRAERPEATASPPPLPPTASPASRLYRTMSSAAGSRRAPRSCSSRDSSAGRPISAWQQAIAAGFASAMRDDDWTFATYRGDAHTLARGAAMGRHYAELSAGTTTSWASKGELDARRRASPTTVIGSSLRKIIDAIVPIALGTVWHRRAVPEVEQVAVYFFGDGKPLTSARPRGAGPGRHVEERYRLRVRQNQLHQVHRDQGRDRRSAPARPAASTSAWSPIVINSNDADAVYTVRPYDRSWRGAQAAAIAHRWWRTLTYQHSSHYRRADPGEYSSGRRGRPTSMAPRPDPALKRAALRGQHGRRARRDRRGGEARSMAAARRRRQLKPWAELLERRLSAIRGLASQRQILADGWPASPWPSEGPRTRRRPRGRPVGAIASRHRAGDRSRRRSVVLDSAGVGRRPGHLQAHGRTAGPARVPDAHGRGADQRAAIVEHDVVAR